MIKNLSAAVGIMTAILTFPHLSVAQSTGPYISGSLGLSQTRDAALTGPGIDSTLESERGFGGSIALGNAYDNNWRAEAELNYHRSGSKSIDSAAASGDTSALGLMLNGYFDLPTNTAWTPYIGIGVGGALLSYDNVSPVGASLIDDQDLEFAYQGIVGINYKLNAQANVFTDYRYFGTTDLNFRTDSATDVDSEFGEHRFMVGLRWSFGTPEPVVKVKTEPTPAPLPEPAPGRAQPAPTPPPAPVQEVQEVPRRYLVFFDWDRSDITSDARTILQQAAANIKKDRVTRIEATGHADLSGTKRYNLGLSQLRAQSVQAELIGLGISANQIVTQWKGELEPLIPTADGIREPQNRRVEIILR